MFETICIEVLYSIFKFLDIQELVQLRLVNKNVYNLFKHSCFSLSLNPFVVESKDLFFQDGIFKGFLHRVVCSSVDPIADEEDDYTTDIEDTGYYHQTNFFKKFKKNTKTYYPYKVHKVSVNSSYYYNECLNLDTDTLNFNENINFKRRENYIQEVTDDRRDAMFRFRRFREVNGIIDLTYIIYSNLCVVKDSDDLDIKEQKLLRLLQIVCSCNNRIELPTKKYKIDCGSCGLQKRGHFPSCKSWVSDYIKTCDVCLKAFIPYVRSSIDIFNCHDFFIHDKKWELCLHYWKIH